MRIPTIKVNQWLDAWDDFRYRPADRQRKPNSFFYVSSIPISILRRLSNVPRRGTTVDSGRQEASGPRVDDIGIQRGFEAKRSEDIRNFVDAGYPWATLRRVEKERFVQVKKPGWLPTALVVNIVKPTSIRQDTKPNPDDLITIEETGENTAELVLPQNAESPGWSPKGRIPPLEVIDGQHRLLAFEEDASIEGKFELPVVLFEDLDISWQAYLFWTINISPKRIGPSLAYDLYPLLRTEDWLDPVAGPLAYRESRAQELTEALWSNPISPWYQRIGMLGRERGKVTQAAFVRSLTLSFIRRSDPGASRPGGLFGAPMTDRGLEVLPWSRAQQAAYLIFTWLELQSAIQTTAAPWAKHVRENTNRGQSNFADDGDPAFSGGYSLLATDQGVRGFLQVSNDISFDLADDLGFRQWTRTQASQAVDIDEVEEAVQELGANEKIANFVQNMCESAAQFDWSSSVTPNLPVEIRNRQALYRAGTGYREVRRQLLIHLSQIAQGNILESARRLVSALQFE